MSARIVVRAPNWLGDVMLSLPAVRDLRRNFPDARLEVLARPGVAPLYGAVPEVDTVVEGGDVAADTEAMRRGAYDVAVLLPNSFGTALAAWRAGIPQRWGFATDARAILLTRGPRVDPRVRGISQVFYYRAMLAGVGLKVSADPAVSLDCPPEWRERGRALLGEGPFVGVNPGAAFGSAKRWVPERFAAAATLAARARGASIAIVGGPGERDVAARVAEGAGVPVRNLCGETSLPELVGVLACLDLLLTNDSGPMHVAAALGVPLVAVFGPTDERETAPVRGTVVRHPVHCSPCGLRECPIDHRCMRRIEVGRVAEAAARFIE